MAIGVLEKKANLDQIITSKRAKLGPDNNFTACMYIYIYVCMYICIVIVWSKLGPFKGYYLVQVGVTIWPTFVFGLFLWWFQAIFAHSVIILCFSCAQLSVVRFFAKLSIQGHSGPPKIKVEQLPDN